MSLFSPAAEATPEVLERFRHRKLSSPSGGSRPEASPCPAAPRAAADLGVGPETLLQLVLKHLHTGGAQRLDTLGRNLGVPASLLQDTIAFLRREHLVEVHGARPGAPSGTETYFLTQQGRERARSHLLDDGYIGPVPVPLDQFQRQIEAQSVAGTVVDRASMAEAFAGLVVPERVLEQLGAAFNSASSLFLYGPAGTGKTMLATQFARLLQGEVAVPYAFSVDGQIVRVFDPVYHVPTESRAPESGAASLGRGGEDQDRRWVRCRRPVVIAGGELTADMLEPAHHAAGNFYEAPLQVKAAGGLLMIDDLGRQQVDVTTLLNRWVVPLESGVDYLALRSGAKFPVPFDAFPVFATNLRPKDLADNAFLRRLGYKVHLGPLDEDGYRAIFAQYCRANGLEYRDQAVTYLLREHYEPTGTPLIACHPRDLVNKIIEFALFEGEEPGLTEEALARAWNVYFVQE
ncbi:MAG: ATP-binding protein [Thiohalorhabdus sp.]|uniref:ATP-binding protein n=1 Tax=Thiohalorhabdus sp. TaxID=3094134 RepID=UPI003980BAAF